jgi:flagellar biosynthesis/type III secretory pathway protein FliH
MSFEPFHPRTLNAQSAAESAAVLERGYRDGLDLARIEAHTQIRAELRAEIEQMRAERDAAIARASGQDAIFEAERLEVARTLEVLTATAAMLESSVGHWQQREVTSMGDIQHQALEFALEVAAMIVKTVPLEQRLRAALEDCVEVQAAAGPVRLRAHPGCVATLKALPHAWDSSKVEIVADPAVAPGDVVCETGHTRIDAGLDATMARVKRALGVGE